MTASGRPCADDSLEPPRVLVVLPNNLGDVIMSTPVLQGLREARRDAEIGFVVEEGFEGALVENPFCDRIIGFPRKCFRDALRSDHWQGGVADVRAWINDVNAGGWSEVLNLCQIDYVSRLVSLFRARDVKGRRALREGGHAVPDTWSQYLYAIPFARRCNALHAVDVYRRIAGVARHRGGYTVVLTEKEKSDAASFLRAGGIDPAARIAALQPGAAYGAKRWPAARFVELGMALVSDGWKVVVTGAPAEAGLAHDIGGAIGAGAMVSAGATTFRQSMALVSHARACVTGDTALMHAAAAFDVPVYALFGATNPVETGPYGNGHWVFCGSCPGRPCFRFECPSMSCMQSIAAHTVLGCIRGGAVPDGAGCDAYRTALDPGGDYRLVATTPGATPYADPDASCLTRRAMGESIPCPEGADPQVAAGNRSETAEFARIVGSMEELLDSFLATRMPESIRRFEEKKNSFGELRGIGAFWAALLNIRLNSVPLLDPVKGVIESRTQCLRTIGQLAPLFSGAPAPGSS